MATNNKPTQINYETITPELMEFLNMIPPAYQGKYCVVPGVKPHLYYQFLILGMRDLETLLKNPPKDKEIISEETMKAIFPNTSSKVHEDIIKAINEYGAGYLTSPQRTAHFLAQVLTEVGERTLLRESLNYTKNSKQTLQKNPYYKKHPEELEKHIKLPKGIEKDETIANIIYADKNRGVRNKLGNINPGDGAKFIGRGLIQLTGRYNYTAFNNWYKKKYPNEKLDFVKNPELLEQHKYAVFSAIYYFEVNGLFKLADKGTTDKIVNEITKKVNKDTNSYQVRVDNFKKIYPIVKNQQEKGK